MTTYEVEQKFRVDGTAATEGVLHELGVRIGEAVTQIDTYMEHPQRSFGVTGEAFRLRRVGDANFVTYKGPRVDTTTKTRRELELALPDGAEFASHLLELLEVLGFRPALEVRKRRRKAIVDWEGGPIEVALDEVEELGTFVELETGADEAGLDGARGRVASLARRLALTRNERASYLELLLAHRSGHEERASLP